MFTKKALFMGGVVILLLIAVVFIFQFTKPSVLRPVSATFVAMGAEGMLKYTIEQLELDKKHGLDLTIQAVEPGEAERRVIAREVDIGSHGPIQLVRSQQEGFEIRNFGPLLTALHGLLVKADSTYQTIDDLKGKKIVVLPKLSAGYQSMALELKILGVDLEKEFSLVFGGIPDALTFLKNGEVDAAFLPDPIAAELVASGKYRELFHLSDLWQEKYGVPYFFVGRVAYANWIDANRDIAKRFIAMSIEAAKYIKTNPEFVAQYAREVLGVETESGVNLIVERLPRVFVTEWNDEAIANAVFTIEKAAELGFIDEAPENPEKLFLKY